MGAERGCPRGADSPRVPEEWDRGWARVWEPIALTEPPGAANGAVVGRRIATYVSVLEPILRDELPGDVEWTLVGHHPP